MRDLTLWPAALNGGLEADLLDEVVWWRTDDFWQYALYAAVALVQRVRRAPRCSGWRTRSRCRRTGGGCVGLTAHFARFSKLWRW